jgi:hypothetical protein
MKKIFLIFLLISLIVFFFLPFLASKALNFFVMKNVEGKIGGKLVLILLLLLSFFSIRDLSI